MQKIALFVILCAFIAYPVPSAFTQGEEIYHLVHVKISSSQDMERLQSLGLDIVEAFQDGVDAVVLDRQLPLLREAGLAYEMNIRDMAAYYASQSPGGTLAGRGFPDGSMGGFYTYSEVVQMLDDWVALYPHLITPKQSIGTSIQGRDIWAVKISDNPGIDEQEPEASFDALIHAREPQSMMTLLYYMKNLLEGYGTDPELTYLVDNREIWFIPVHNPDGYAYNEQTNPNGGGMWRKNRRNNGGGSYGVDLNRNYGYKWGYDNYGSSPNPSDETYRGPSAFSEPETQAVRDFILNRPIVTSWNTHTYSNLYLCPFGYDNVLPSPNDWTIYQEYLADISKDNGYVTGPIYSVLYAANGGATDWHYASAGVLNITPEIGSSSQGGFWPYNYILELAEENYPAIKYWSWVAGSYVLLDGHTLSDDNSDGLFLPGEPVEVTLTLFNKGLGAAVSDVTATISSSSPYVTILTGTHNFGKIQGFSKADNGASPLKVKVKSNTPYGESITLDVNVTFDGYTHALPLSFVCGVPSVLASTDMETDPGWTVGDTGDNATHGIWERDDPIGTSSGGEPIQPEDDHTPSPGTQCFVTGNNSSTAGGDDVDNGKTTLKTAVYDLNGIKNPQITYWRWYADLGSSPNNDIFQVDISNDGGANWVNVSKLDHTVNSWQKVAFNVSDFVNPTASVMMRFIAKDEPNDSLCEACIDDFEILTYSAPVSLVLSAPPKVGTTVNITVSSPSDPNLGYLIAASLGTYPAIPIGSRWFPLQFDFFLMYSLNPSNGIFYNFIGLLDGSGYSSAPQFVIPGMPGLIGTEIFFGAVTLEASAPEGVKNISPPLQAVLE